MTKKERKFFPIEGVTRNEVLKSQNDTKYNYLRTRRSRRTMVIGISSLTALVSLSPWFSEKASNYIATLGGLMLLIGYLLIRTSVRHIADSPDELLDERQIALRDRSYLHSYRILSSLFVVLIIALFIRIDLSEIPFVISDILSAGTWFSLILLMAGLPSMVVAWCEKGEDEI